MSRLKSVTDDGGSAEVDSSEFAQQLLVPYTKVSAMACANSRQVLRDCEAIP